MAIISDILFSVNPADGATAVPLNQKVTVVFSTEIDESAFAAGSLFIEGPDNDQVIYPGYSFVEQITPGTEKEILSSPGYDSIVPGTFVFSRLDLILNSGIDTLDTEGTLDIYRSKIVFSPTVPLIPLTTYKVYLVGDDEDVTDIGVQTRTVFDAESGSLNSGNGSVEFSGSYTGAATQDVINIRITVSGLAGVAQFESWKDSAPLNLEGPYLSSLSSTNLIDGVSIKFLEEGLFEVGDTFTVVVKEPTIYSTTLTFSFTTGNGSITAVPTTTSTSITGDPVLSTSTGFTIVSTSPEDNDVNLTLVDSQTIIIEFSSDVDPTTVTDETVQIFSQPISDHPLISTTVPTGEMAKQLTVSGNRIIITL